MTANEFMKAWKEICLTHVFCDDCDLRNNCVLYDPGFWGKDVTEESMNNLIDNVKDIAEGWNEI